MIFTESYASFEMMSGSGSVSMGSGFMSCGCCCVGVLTTWGPEADEGGDVFLGELVSACCGFAVAADGFPVECGLVELSESLLSV